MLFWQILPSLKDSSQKSVQVTAIVGWSGLDSRIISSFRLTSQASR